jgi:GR25 family glycosyltransferase involved in LPS biosynthesis
MLAWQKIVQRALDFALVIEDDVRLNSELVPVIKAALRVLPPGWDIVHMDGRARARPSAFKMIEQLGTDGRHIVRYSRAPWGAAAYLISLAGAQKLLAPKARTVPVDYEFRVPWRWRLDVYGIEPSPIDLGTHALTSSIKARGGNSLMFGSPRNPRSLASGCFNISKLGLTTWLSCLIRNSAHRMIREAAGTRLANRLAHRIAPVGRISTTSPRPLGIP